ncbi:FecR family protein [Sphingopyxis sp. MWB1]|uniref:FecR family protein n=1 Tax=Sphingopyxis sp. MWB1 TaxID=1537715 RepID=UPI00068B6976|nr:FecR domain-containing protein [Sphingopyxis sp. MWB1]
MTDGSFHNPAALRSEAAHWFNLRLSGDMSAEDDFRFQQWLEQSEAHRRAYQSIDRAWSIAGAAINDPALGREALAPAETEAEAQAEAPARRWRALAIAASILLMVALGSLSWQLLSQNESAVDQTFHTATGQRTTVTLTDGSEVTLDSDTEIRFDDTPGERLVELVDGRAYFRVAPDRARPFIVRAGGKRIRAVGTAFEVSFEDGEVGVILAEGKVRVEDGVAGGGNGTDMVPGRRLVIGADRNWTLNRVDVDKETSWTEGRLIFMHDRLADAIAQVNRYSDRKLEFAGGAAPDRRIVGVFETGDVEGFVTALELNGIARRSATSEERIELVPLP